MTLKNYRKKRDFKQTKEPSGKKKSTQTKHLYLIQKHAASHLHYDFRLEMEGVLKSWAVPKGPSLDPAVKRLAVHVEDHPIEYGSFEGAIPKGQYGGGTVMLWDTGQWEIQDAPGAVQAYKKGSMTFVIKGKKLKGLWKLIQIKKDPKNWLLIKIDDKYARAESDYDITAAKPLSIVSKKPIDKIAGYNEKTPKKKVNAINVMDLVNIKKSKMPKTIFPQLATLVEIPPEGPQWLHEIKFDGYRLVCFINDKTITLTTRGQQNWTKKFPSLVAAIAKLKLKNVILDGEIVILDQSQRSDFQLLQNAMHNQSDAEIIYYVFDLLYYNGFDLMQVPLLDRKKLLRQLIPSDNNNIRFSDHIINHGAKLFEKARQLGLEGIVSKEINSRYLEKRTKNWLKSKCTHRQEFIVGGYTQPRGSRQYFGSLLIGVYATGKKLQYCGHVGTGFSRESLKAVAKILQKNIASQMPFTKKPNDIKNVSWVKPNIVVEIEFTEMTKDGILRHPSFQGLRIDKSPKEITLEKPAKPLYPFTHPEKILYPKAGITKIKLAEFYENIQEWILPYLVKRPLTLVRCPQGASKPCFYQKHIAKETLNSLYSIPIKEKHQTSNYLYLKDIRGVMELVQLGVLEIHTWNCHIDNIEKPDEIVFDLDPAPDLEWKKVVSAAHFIKEQLEKIQLTSFVKTTGGKGLHIVLPIKRIHTWEEVKNFTHAFVKTIVELKPQDFVEQMTKSKRTGKIFIDYLRNQRGATSVAPYSTRAIENAPVSTPLAWDELTSKIKSSTFTVNNLSKRLSTLQEDPWENFFNIRQSLKLKDFDI